MEIRTLLEQQLSDALTASGVLPLDIPVFPGVSDVLRPPRYVAVVCPEAPEPRGFRACRCLVEFRIVAPVYASSSDGSAGTVAWLQSTLSLVTAWATPLLQGASSDSLQILGSAPPTNRSEVRERQRAEIVSYRVGASVPS